MSAKTSSLFRIECFDAVDADPKYIFAMEMIIAMRSYMDWFEGQYGHRPIHLRIEEIADESSILP